MTIIFDFNRTLFDPVAGTLIPGAFEVLEHFQSRKHELFLVSRLEPGRTQALSDLGIESFFKKTFFVEDKSNSIETIVRESTGEVYVVGDYLYDEIRAGNRCGARTIWFQQGMFALQEPKQPHDVPWRTIRALSELKNIIGS